MPLSQDAVRITVFDSKAYGRRFESRVPAAYI
jgi:hypothetical protein